MSIEQFEERMAEIKGESDSLTKRRLDTLIEFGEKAIPELRGNPGFSELAAQIDEIDEKVSLLKEREAQLLEEKAVSDKEEKERLIMYTCVKCKTINVDGSHFCEECGGPVGTLPREYCKACGTLNYPGMKFCGECGVRLEEVVT